MVLFQCYQPIESCIFLPQFFGFLINENINEHRKSKWTEKLDKCTQGSNELWKTIKNLNNPVKKANNVYIKFNNKPESDNGKIANKLNRQYTPSLSKKPSKEFRSTLRKIKMKKTNERYNITETQTREAIKNSKNSKAIGLEGLSPVMLKHIGPNAIRYLTATYNHTVNSAIVPSKWKTGRISPY